MSVKNEDKYAEYLRKSRKDMELEAMGDGETLARHHARLMNLAARNNIHPDQIVTYRELVSGDSIDERPEMQRLLSDVFAKKYKGVLVIEVERLARGNTSDQGLVAAAFEATSTKIITETKTYDPNSETDQNYFEFGLFMSRQEYKTIKRRMQSGKLQSVMEGNYILPQTVFGYEIVRYSKKDRTLKIIPEQAKLVHMIFDWYTVDRRSTGWIARQLTIMGIPTTKKKPEWNRNTIRDMLANPTYIGKVWWGKRRTIKEYNESLGKLVKVVKEDGIPAIYDGKHEGIIYQSQYELAQKITLESKNPCVKVNKEIVNPLAGILECCECGRKMIAANYGGRSRYRIMHARDTICKKKSMFMDDVVSALTEALTSYIEDFEKKMEADDNQTTMEKYKSILDAMEAELPKLEKKRRKLFADYEDGTYTREEFIERKQHYNSAIEELKKQIQAACESIPEPVNYTEKIESLHSMIQCVQDPNISAKAKNDFLKQFIDKITYDSIDYGRGKGGKAILEVFFK